MKIEDIIVDFKIALCVFTHGESCVVVRFVPLFTDTV